MNIYPHRVLGESTVPGGPCILITSVSSWEHLLRCAVCLLWRADLRLRPCWQMSTIQDLRKMWLAAGNLLKVWWKMSSLGLRLQQPLAFWLWLSKNCLSASRLGRGQKKYDTQLGIWWVMEVKSDAVKRNIAWEPGMLGPRIKANWKWSDRRWQEWISTF